MLFRSLFQDDRPAREIEAGCARRRIHMDRDFHFRLRSSLAQRVGRAFQHQDGIVTSELHAGDAVRATFQLIGYDSKRLHYFEQLVHATDGFLAATSENLAIHVDMDSSKSAPMPPRVLGRLEKMAASHARLPRPQAAGRGVGMKKD